jgi:hypothetical protein
MRHALSGGLWLHRFVLNGEPMAHLVSSDRDAVIRAGRVIGMDERWIQFKKLKSLDSGEAVDSWHWDLLRHRLDLALELATKKVPQGVGRPKAK